MSFYKGYVERKIVEMLCNNLLTLIATKIESFYVLAKGESNSVAVSNPFSSNNEW